MKNLNNYITEKLRINKNTKLNGDFSDLMNGIDVSKWEWQKVSMRQYDENKHAVEEFAKQEFGDNNYMNEIFKQTYKYYLSVAYGWPEEKIEKSYNNAIKTLDKIGWTQFSWSNLEQGWWHFVAWCIEQIKNN